MPTSTVFGSKKEAKLREITGRQGVASGIRKDVA